MKCPECVRMGQQSRLYMPTSYFSTAKAGTETYYDEDGIWHHHDANRSGGTGWCSQGHTLDVMLSTKCPAPNCDYGDPQTITLHQS
jgi:hypothetical protein